MSTPQLKDEKPIKRDTVDKFKLKLIPGIFLCLVIMIVGTGLTQYMGQWINSLQGLPTTSSSPLSSIFFAIILGLLIRNVIGLQEVFKDGVSFSIKYILKFGIILLGIRLSLHDVLVLGTWGIPIILACVATGLIVTLWFTNRMKQSHRLGTLIACGTGICGVTAIVAISPGIKANDEEVAYAVANITLFGVIAMFAYPYLAHFMFQGDPVMSGLFLGTAIHETAQVAGSALIYSQIYDSSQVIDVATITKLTRNILILAVVPMMSFYYLKKSHDRHRSDAGTIKKWYQLIPLFVIGFLLMAVVRTIGDAGVDNNGAAFGLLDSEQWIGTWTALNNIGSNYFLGIAMAAVGLSTNFNIFKGLGMKPFFIGMVASLSVGVISFMMVMLIGSFIVF